MCYPKYYFKSAVTAYNYYNEAIKISNNRELNARCLYLMAKCEQNTMFNNETNYYGDGSMTDVTSKYKSSFKRLKSEYSDTEFNKMILKECSFYRYYCSI